MNILCGLSTKYNVLDVVDDMALYTNAKIEKRRSLVIYYKIR